MSFIEITGLYKYYGVGQNRVAALKNINLKIEEGEFVVILGSSGAGKTTLLNILGGMDRLSEGSFSVGDEKLENMNNKQLSVFRRNRIGFVFQFYNLMPNLTALENVRLAESVSSSAIDSRVALDMVGLKERMNNFPAQLSGGEQQRVSIARAVVKNPSLLLCDEPTGALDSKTGISVLKMLEKINREQKKTTVIVTHNSSIAEMATRVVRIQDGEIVSNTVNDAPKSVEELVW